MGRLKFDIPHTLAREEARLRVEKLLGHWSNKYGIASHWSGDAARVSGKVMGISLDADLDVREGAVGGEVTDPGFLLREKAKKYVVSKIRDYLDPSRSLSDLGD